MLWVGPNRSGPSSPRRFRRGRRAELKTVLTLALLGGCAGTTGAGADDKPGKVDSSSILTQSQMMALDRMPWPAPPAARRPRSTPSSSRPEMRLVDPPAVELVRWVDLSALAPTRVACLAEQGFSATAVGGAGIDYDQVPPAQEEAYKAAIYTCEAKYSLHPYYGLPPSTAALSRSTTGT